MRICTAPAGEGRVEVNRTLPDLLDEAVARYPNPRAFNQRVNGQWETWSTQMFQERARRLAAGWMALGLQPGDKVAMFMHSNADFCLVDMGTLLAAMVDVPIYLTYTPEFIEYTIHHSESQVLVVADEGLLERLWPLLPRLQHIRHLVLVRPSARWEAQRANLPPSIQGWTLDELLQRGQALLEKDPTAVDRRRQRIQPEDLATILYTSGTTGRPKGVMLTHRNLTFNVISAFSVYFDHFVPQQEVILSFLPMTHIFARMMQYGFMWLGAAVYFTEPKRLVEDAQEVRPTAFIVVPRLVERIYERIQERAQTMKGLQGWLLRQAVAAAQAYDWLNPPRGLQALRLRILDALVYRRWRALLGGRLKWANSGGAALRAELVHFFAAAGIYFLEGYGLTETSPVITVNRLERPRPGTAGQPIPGVEVRIAEDGEILTRGPHVMKGYYKNPEATREVIDEEGWFHTGDIGELDEDCYLRITDRKKHLFKLSTGKYIAPQAMEDALRESILVDQALVVGEGRKFAAALLFLSLEGLRSAGLCQEPCSPETFLHDARLHVEITRLVRTLNQRYPRWMRIRRVALLPETLTMEDGMLTPTLKVRRRHVLARYREVVEALYQTPPGQGPWVILDVEH